MLPSGLTARPARRSDLNAWVAVAAEVERHSIGEVETDAAAVEGYWAETRFELERDARVVVDESGSVVGHSSVWEALPGVVWVLTYVVPRLAPTVEPALLGDGLDRAREIAAASPDTAWLVQVPNYVADATRGGWIAAHGLTVVRHFYRMAIDFDHDAPPAVEALPGVVVRRVDPVTELSVVHRIMEEAFVGHWNSKPTSYDEFAARFVHSRYDPRLWFLAELDGVPVGALIGRANPDGRGWVRELGVLSHARGRGIGGALLSRAFREFHALGWPGAGLGVDADNATGATRLYARAGMRPVVSVEWWQGPVT
ncbi:MAG: GNAT family N-acetyltransferase [Mycobacteriales bacterium]|nr:GNAT family N-acetyltransferase [Frankia sp.]